MLAAQKAAIAATKPGNHWNEAHEAAVQVIFDGLEWLGMTPDEPPVYQAARADRHREVVERIIGGKAGTGGTSGVKFLQRALDTTFFPELIEVRTRIG